MHKQTAEPGSTLRDNEQNIKNLFQEKSETCFSYFYFYFVIFWKKAWINTSLCSAKPTLRITEDWCVFSLKWWEVLVERRINTMQTLITITWLVPVSSSIFGLQKPNQQLCSLSPKMERESEKVKCRMNKKVFPEALTLQSPENCVFAQLVHSSCIGGCSSNQSKDWPNPAVIMQTQGWGTHHNDPLACPAQIFSRSASDSHINQLTDMIGAENGSIPSLSFFLFSQRTIVSKSTRWRRRWWTICWCRPHPTVPVVGGLPAARLVLEAAVNRTLVQIRSRAFIAPGSNFVA